MRDRRDGEQGENPSVNDDIPSPLVTRTITVRDGEQIIIGGHKLQVELLKGQGKKVRLRLTNESDGDVDDNATNGKAVSDE